MLFPVILFFTLDLERNGREGKIPSLGIYFVYAYFFKHVNLSMLLSFMPIKKEDCMVCSHYQRRLSRTSTEFNKSSLGSCGIERSSAGIEAEIRNPHCCLVF